MFAQEVHPARGGDDDQRATTEALLKERSCLPGWCSKGHGRLLLEVSLLRFLRRLAPLLLLASPLAAQLAPLGAPKGTFRFDLGGVFESADRRLFDGNTEDYLAPFGGNPFGANRIPFLRTVDSTISAATGQFINVSLGRQQAHGQLTIGTGIIGGALGLTRKLTLYGRIPLVTTRVQAHLALDTTNGNAGLNRAHPVLGDADQQNSANQFFNDFGTALDGLQSRIANGSYNGDPQLLALAQAVLTEATAMRDGLANITSDATASPYLPTQTSAAGIALINRIRGLQDTLATTLGVSSGFVSQDPVLPEGRLDPLDFSELISSPDGPVGGLPFGESKLSRMGDIDVGFVYTLIDRFDRPGKTGGIRLAIDGTMKLPTGQLADPNNLLSVGTGNGRYEAGGSGTLDVGAGRWGSRFTGGYLMRFPSNRVLRLTSPESPYADLGSITNVRLDAGELLNVGARPFFRLARNLAIHGIAEYWRQSRAKAEYPRAIDSIPGVSASVVTEGSDWSFIRVGGGISYVGRAVRECEPDRKCGLPIDASWSYGTIVAGSGGAVPKFRTTQVEIRWYWRWWR
jgi:hypothetical protein